MRLFNISPNINLEAKIKEMSSMLEKVDGCVKVLEYKVEHIKEKKKSLLSILNELGCRKKNSVYIILKTTGVSFVKRKNMPKVLDRLKTFRAIREHLEYSILTLERADKKIKDSYKRMVFI